MFWKTFMITMLCAVAPLAVADLTIEFEGPDGARLSVLYIKGDDLRMDSFDQDEGTMLFNAERKEISIVEHERRRYMVIDQSTINEMRDAMDQAMQMIEQMGMSREQIEQMMPGMPEKVEIIHRRTGESREVGGRACEVVETRINEEIESTACVTSAGSLGIGSGEIATMKAMSDMFTAMAMDLIPDDMLTIDIDGMDGIPLEAYDAQGRVTERLSSVSDDAVDGSIFAVPSGFRRQSLEMMGR